jgi:hypothetical protein
LLGGADQPDPITPADDVFYAPLIGTSVTNSTGTYEFPSAGDLPSDKSMWQPRLGISWDVNGDGQSVVRGSAGIYYARLASLNMASVRHQRFAARPSPPAAGSGPSDYGELITLLRGRPPEHLRDEQGLAGAADHQRHVLV